MRLLNPLRRILVRFEPIRVFLALLIAVLIWLYPVLNHSEISRSSGEPLQEYGRITLVTAVDAKAPNCSNACKINVCTKWIALGEPGCPSKTNPWDIGCCLSWEIQCDPDCVDPTPTEPPTISGVLNCTQSNNGWCTGSLTLNLSASDPQGASVLISGILNGTPFACPNAATSCSIPITSEGAGTISYRVDSATGLFAIGSSPYSLDLSTPQINASLLGTSGADNYYISTVTVSASASDAASGVQSFEYSLDNGGNWSSVSSPLDFNDGDYTLLLRATDQAGWSAQTSTQSFSVDTTTPLITISATSTPGNNGWRISPVQFNASASDAGSGLASLTCEVNATVSDCSSIYLADGIWQVHVTACDRAGLCSDETRDFNVDTTTPTLTLSFLGDPGQNNWYTSAVQVTANASDAGSGIDSLQKSLDGGGTWSVVPGSIAFTGEGLHSYQLIACDKAGLCTDTGSQQVKIDTIAPTLHLPSSWTLGDTAYYNAEDHGSRLAYANTRVEGRNYTDGLFGASITSELYWNGKDSKGRQVPPGEYDMVVKVFDQAGNEAKGHTMVGVDLLSSLWVASLPDRPDGDPTPASSLPTAASSFGGQTGASSIPPQTDTSTMGNSTHTVLLTKDTASIKFGVDSATAPVSDQQTGNILWGAAAAALVGATLADWQKKREEEQRARAQAKQQERREKQAEYDRINRAYQAALDARKAADLAHANDHAAAIEAKLAREDAAEEARYLAAQKAREQAAFDHRMSEHDGDQAMVEAWKAQQEKQTAAKVLAAPVRQDGDPPQPKSFFEKLWDLLFSNAPSWFSGIPKPTPTQTSLPPPHVEITHAATATSTVTLTPTPTSTVAPTLVAFVPALNDYGIRTEGYNEVGVDTILNAAGLTAKKLLPYIPDSEGYPSTAFQIAMGEMTIMIDADAHIDNFNGNCLTTSANLLVGRNIYSPDLYEAFYDISVDKNLVKPKVVNGVVEYTAVINNQTLSLEKNGSAFTYKASRVIETPHLIVCNNLPTEANLIHEFEHVMINQQTSARGINIFELVRSIPLGDGNYLDYQDGYWIRQDAGFLYGTDSWEHKPFDNDVVSGIAKNEHSADMFLNWIYDGKSDVSYGFTNDLSGDARRQEMDRILKSMFGK